MKTISHLFVLLGSLLSYSVFAADVDDGVAKLEAVLGKMLPGAEITQIKATPVAGLYEVILGPQVVYMNGDASYYLSGEMIEMATRKNLTESSKSVLRLSKIKNYPEANMVVYTPKKKIEHTITVVTDIDCPYCRRLHNEIAEYMENGIKVRYLFMPLKGKQDFATTVSVWCSDDRNESLDIAKAGGEIEAKTCDNPISEHLSLARAMGVNGTPAIILEDGEMLPGYVPVKKLVDALNKS
ncbi:MAG: DsbC family protein [Gammaproteobacteria bacterium]